MSAACCALLALAPGGPPPELPAEAPSAARRFERRVVSLAARETPAGRVEAVAAELEALGLVPQRRAFPGPRREGVNLLAIVPPAAVPPGRTLTLGAHLDRVAVGRGAVDNAGGCAAVLELVGRFQARPLTRHRVVGLWFDQEEQGLLGSRAFVEAAGESNAEGAAAGLPDLFVNVDVFAYGETLWVHHPSGRDRPAAAAFAAGAAPFPSVVGAAYPPSDHQSFAALRDGAAAGTPAARMRVLSLSLLPREQITETVEWLENRGGGRPARAGLPAILSLIHTANDTPAAVRPAEAAAGIDAVEAGLRALDAAAGRE